MKEKKDCKIVQDLLPNYVEKLTNEETNQYIKEHLAECKECNKIYENMQKDLGIQHKRSDAKAINYMKKYNHKLKTLKIILLIIFLLLFFLFPCIYNSHFFLFHLLFLLLHSYNIDINI